MTTILMYGIASLLEHAIPSVPMHIGFSMFFGGLSYILLIAFFVFKTLKQYVVCALAVALFIILNVIWLVDILIKYGPECFVFWAITFCSIGALHGMWYWNGKNKKAIA